MKQVETKKDNSVQVEKDKAAMRILQGSNTVKAQEAFAQLYARYKSPIFFEALKFVRMNRELARDLTQEIFTKLYANRMQYDFANAFSTWLYKIAKNHIIDHKRKTKVEIFSIESLKSDFGHGDDSGSAEVDFQLEDLTANTFEGVVRQERAAIVRKALDLIKSQETKTILELLFIEDMAYEKVAEKMNLPLGTVKALMFRGKNELKDLLAKTSVAKDYGRVYTKKHVFKTKEGKAIEQEEEELTEA